MELTLSHRSHPLLTLTLTLTLTLILILSPNRKFHFQETTFLDVSGHGKSEKHGPILTFFLLFFHPMDFDFSLC